MLLVPLPEAVVERVPPAVLVNKTVLPVPREMVLPKERVKPAASVTVLLVPADRARFPIFWLPEVRLSVAPPSVVSEVLPSAPPTILRVAPVMLVDPA